MTVGVPVAVQVQRAGRLEDAVHLNRAFAHPARIDVDAALPAVLEGTDLSLVAPDDLVETVREERRIEVNQVDAVRRDFCENLLVVVAVDDARL